MSKGQSPTELISRAQQPGGKLLHRLALFVALAGCMAAGGAQPPGPIAGVRVVYESGGEITGLSTLGAGHDKEVLVWVVDERQAADPETEEARGGSVGLWLLDTAGGQARLLHDRVLGMGMSQPYSFWVGLAADGRRVAAALSNDPAEPGSSMYASDDFRKWALLTPGDKRSRILPRWSPDGGALAFLSLDAQEWWKLIPMEAVVMSVPRPAKGVRPVTITPKGGRSIDVAWAADGRRLYHVVHLPERNEHYVEAVEWPSLKRHTIMTGGPMGLLSVAAQSGDVVWLEEAGEAKGAAADETERPQVLWQLRPGGELTKTPVRLDRAPSFVSALSPDGKWWAVAPRMPGDRIGRRGGHGLVVYSLADGTPHTYPALNEKEITSLAWVLGGRGLVVAERGKRVWLVGMEAAP